MTVPVHNCSNPRPANENEPWLGNNSIVTNIITPGRGNQSCVADVVSMEVDEEEEEWSRIAERLNVPFDGVDLTGDDRNVWFKDFRVAGVENRHKRARFISFVNKQKEKKSTDSLGAVVKAAVREAFEEQKTETATMSKAKEDFTDNLLNDLGFAISMKPRSEKGTVQHHVFDWEPSEEARTAAAGERLTALMKPRDMSQPLEIVPVTGFMLREVKRGKRKATGKTDLRVAVQGWTPPTSNAFSEARGLVELKVETNPFSEPQLHLELVSVSTMSVYGEGVALLATDCLLRWGIWSFESKHVIRGLWYRDSTEALREFKEMMETIEERRDLLKLQTIVEGGGAGGGSGGDKPNDGEPSHPKPKQDGGRNETFGPSGMTGNSGRNIAGAKAVSVRYEQDLTGFEEEIGSSELEAFEREQFLTAFATALHNETGEECSVPIWARAHSLPGGETQQRRDCGTGAKATSQKIVERRPVLTDT